MRLQPIKHPGTRPVGGDTPAPDQGHSPQYLMKSLALSSREEPGTQLAAGTGRRGGCVA